jgi:hypothetical protein
MPIMGGGGGGAAFTGGTITQPLVIDLSGGSGTGVPLTLKVSYNAQNDDIFQVVDTDTSTVIDSIDSGATLTVGDGLVSQGSIHQKADDGSLVTLADGSVSAGVSVFATSTVESGNIDADAASQLWRRISSGALPTKILSSGVGSVIDATTDRMLVVPCTLNPTAGAAATVLVQLSPDGLTYSTLGTLTVPAGVTFDGEVKFVQVMVPAVWLVKLTATNATIGTATYY